MDLQIAGRLDRVEALFPPERIEKSKARWKAAASGEQLDAYPFLLAPFTFSYYDDLHTPRERLVASLNEFIFRGRLEDDFIPALFPGCRQSTIPNMLGAAEVIRDGDCTCDHLIQDASDIDALPEPSIGEGSVARMWLDMQAYFLAETGGRLPVHVADMQGPFDAAAQLWNYDGLIIAAYQEPERYDRLMRLTSQAFAMLWEAQAELLGEHFVPTHLSGWDWAPLDYGVTLSADALVMMSPAFFDGCYRPYLEKLGERFGKVTVHSCGDFAAVIPALASVPCVQGVHAGQMTVEQVFDAGWPAHKELIATATVDQAPRIGALIRDHGIRVKPTFMLPPPTQDGHPVPPMHWTSEHWDAAARQVDQVRTALNG